MRDLLEHIWQQQLQEAARREEPGVVLSPLGLNAQRRWREESEAALTAHVQGMVAPRIGSRVDVLQPRDLQELKHTRAQIAAIMRMIFVRDLRGISRRFELELVSAGVDPGELTPRFRRRVATHAANLPIDASPVALPPGRPSNASGSIVGRSLKRLEGASPEQHSERVDETRHALRILASLRRAYALDSEGRLPRILGLDLDTVAIRAAAVEEAIEAAQGDIDHLVIRDPGVVAILRPAADPTNETSAAVAAPELAGGGGLLPAPVLPVREEQPQAPPELGHPGQLPAPPQVGGLGQQPAPPLVGGLTCVAGPAEPDINRSSARCATAGADAQASQVSPLVTLLESDPIDPGPAGPAEPPGPSPAVEALPAPVREERQVTAAALPDEPDGTETPLIHLAIVDAPAPELEPAPASAVPFNHAWEASIKAPLSAAPLPGNDNDQPTKPFALSAGTLLFTLPR